MTQHLTECHSEPVTVSLVWESVNALPQSHSRASLERFGPPMARLRKLRLCFFCPRQRKAAVLPAAR